MRALLVVCVVAVGALPARGAESELRRRQRLALDAYKRGQHDQAARLFLEALELAPDSPTLLGHLTALAGGGDPRALWLYQSSLATCKANGSIVKPKGPAKVKPLELQPGSSLARLRARALEQILALAKPKASLGGTRVAVRAVQRTAWALAEHSPALRKVVAIRFKASKPRHTETVLKALEEHVPRLMGENKHAQALLGARLLVGLLNQRGRSDPRQKLVVAPRVQRAHGWVDRCRQALAKAWPPPAKLEALEQVPRTGRPAWSTRHRSWTHPARADSPTGLYRIESVCGINTLRTVLKDIEIQHKRLAAWYGRDPFQKRPGTVRLCRSWPDLEREGQPYWWAPAFQSGDLTRMVINFTERESIARTLTHELTHRFDGTLYPGLPAWLVEGRAVYTETASASASATTLDPRLFAAGRMYETYWNGYGRPPGLTKLLRGTIKDYRDNYDAGYSLWIYLTRYAKAKYGKMVELYLRSFATGPEDGLVRFRQYFLDGTDGRAKDLVAFCRDFDAFLRAAAEDAERQPAWMKQWHKDHFAALRERWESLDTDVTRGGDDDLEEWAGAVFDRSNWPRVRRRHAEPAFGEGHAVDAGAWLAEHGAASEALAALDWGLAVEEESTVLLRRAAALFRRLRAPVEAWVMESRAARRAQAPVPPPPAALSRLHAAVQRLLTAQREAVASLLQAGRPMTARAIRADHDRLAVAAGIPPLGPRAVVAADEWNPRTVPQCPPPESVLIGDLSETSWAPLETRPTGAWHRPTDSRLVLGRRTSGAEISGVVRDRTIKRIFVESRAHIAGTTVFRTRVTFLSARVNAAVVLGKTRRDRGLMLRFDGGDWNYAQGKSAERVPLKFIDVSLTDLRPFERSTAPLTRRVRFRQPRDSFDLEVRVHGSFVRVWVNGEPRISHRLLTGIPVRGRVGFALYSGLVRFDNPVLRRHRILGSAAICPCGEHDEPLHLGGGSLDWRTLIGRRFPGLGVRGPHGEILVWQSKQTPKVLAHETHVAERLDRIDAMLRRMGLPISARVAYPKDWPKGEDTGKEDEWGGKVFGGDEEETIPKSRVLHHAGHAGLQAEQRRMWRRRARELRQDKDIQKEEAESRAREEIYGEPVWIYVDSTGVVRAWGQQAPKSQGWGWDYLAALLRRMTGR